MKLLSLPISRSYHLAICSEKREIAISTDTKMIFWNWVEDECHSPAWELGFPRTIWFLRYSPDGSTLAIAYDPLAKETSEGVERPSIELVDAQNWSVIHQIYLSTGVEDFAFSPGNQPIRFIEANPSPKIPFQIWELFHRQANKKWILQKRKGFSKCRFYREGIIQVGDEAISRFPCLLEMNERTPIASELSTEDKVKPLKEKRKSKSSKTTRSGDAKPLKTTPEIFSFKRIQRENALAIHPDGTRLLLGGVSGRVRLWSIDEARELTCWDWPIGYVTSIAFSSDGCLAVAVGLRNQVVVWDLEG